jgi:hypothetical protein
VDATRAAGVVPEWAHKIVAATDINPSYGLTTAVLAFGRDQVATVLRYWVHARAPLPISGDATPNEQRRAITVALADLGRDLSALQASRPNHWIIDGGGTPESTVVDFCHNAPRVCGIQATTYFGRGWRQYRMTAKHKIAPGEQMHRVIERFDRQWLIVHADYWREVAQRAWLTNPGAPGSCSLPPGRHDEFAEQICREQLEEKSERNGRVEWYWPPPRGKHDYGDCMTMAYAGAAMLGIGTGDAVKVGPTRGPRRSSVRHIAV